MPGTLATGKRRFSIEAEPSLIEEARRAAGMHDAPLAELVRRALLLLAGRADAAQAAKVPMGRPRKNP